MTTRSTTPIAPADLPEGSLRFELAYDRLKYTGPAIAAEEGSRFVYVARPFHEDELPGYTLLGYIEPGGTTHLVAPGPSQKRHDAAALLHANAAAFGVEPQERALRATAAAVAATTHERELELVPVLVEMRPEYVAEAFRAQRDEDEIFAAVADFLDGDADEALAVRAWESLRYRARLLSLAVLVCCQETPKWYLLVAAVARDSQLPAGAPTLSS